KHLDARGRTLFGALAVELGNMTSDTSIGQAARLIGEAQLDRFVAISLHGADLKHVARAGLDDRHRDHLPRFVVELRHPDLAAEYSNSHRSVPCQLPDGRTGGYPHLPVRLPIIFLLINCLRSRMTNDQAPMTKNLDFPSGHWDLVIGYSR